MHLKTKFILSNILSFLFMNLIHAQQKVSISGVIKARHSGEPMPGADIYLLDSAASRTVSNGYGFFSLQVLPGTYDLVVSYTGYSDDTVKITVNKSLRQDIYLDLKTEELNSVSVHSSATQHTAGIQKIDAPSVKEVPVIFGEKDILKTLQLLPGVKSAGDGNSGLYIRGGGADQNLILLDGATVYNTSHLMGFFSVFNSDIIKDLTLYKSFIPAQYGGRLSSVVDITTNDGNNREFHGSGGVGLIASRFTLEGPIKKNKGSFVISGRRTYADMLLKLSNDSSINKNTLYFYDINAKGEYTFNDKNKIYVFGYLGKDKFEFNGKFGINYGNVAGAVQWNHIFGNRLFSNTSFNYTDYNYTVHLESGSTGELYLKSKIQDLSFKENFQYSINGNDKIRFGAEATLHMITPGILDASQTADFHSTELQKKYSAESDAYISHEITFPNRINLNYGIRLSMFNVLGPGDFYTYDKNGNPADTTSYTKGQLVKTYINAEPRLSLSYPFKNAGTLTASYMRTTQNLHLISNSLTAYPTDMWIPSSVNVKPEKADQLSLGYVQQLHNNMYEFSSEVYYRRLLNQIDYKNGAVLQVNENIESQLLFGRGRAYGWEVFFKKKLGKLTGWISYTLSRTERQINGINNNDWYPARQDETHNVSATVIFKLNRKWTFSANQVYNTGNAVTMPNGKYVVNGNTAFYYTQRNGYRMPAYHRLDLSATLYGKQRKYRQSSWTFSLYNVYGRENPYTIEFDNSPTNPLQTTAKAIYLFRWVPSVTYNFNF